MNAVAWLLEPKSERLDSRAMLDWQRYEIENHVQNGCGFALSTNAHGIAWYLGHRIPPENSP
ncbi:hypothetical protein PSYRMG_09765 [Pseudomonas syringae UMAF0158]|nr:hypothetical protein PSYRMG_09765 [Pseudomonas syringae UMAF0158]